MIAVALEGTSSQAEAEAGLAPRLGEDTSQTVLAVSRSQEQGVLGRSLEGSSFVAALAGEFEAVVGESVVATAERGVLVVRAEKTRSWRQTPRAQQQNHGQVWEVCMLEVAEWAGDGLETPRSSGEAQTRR